MQQSNEVINIGQLHLRFMQTAESTNDEMVVFEFTIPPGAKVPIPHYHEKVDEVVYGLEGTTTSTITGQAIEVNAGDTLFIPKGATHHHDNRTQNVAKTLVVLTPATIGPAYFREMGELIKPGTPPDPQKAKEIMLRHGLVPVAS